MLACPSCPAPVAGAPFIQLDHRIACWATDNLSAAGLRAWLRLLTHHRNDRAIPRPSVRRLAQIAGLSLGAAHKVLQELATVLTFAGEELEGRPEGEPGPSEAVCPRPGQGCSRHERGVHDMNARRSRNERKRSRNERPTYRVQEGQEEEKNPPPTSSATPPGAAACGPDEEEGILGTDVRGEGQANSRPGAPLGGPLQLDPRLEPVAAELTAYWRGKRGSRTPLAFAAQQAELLQISASPIGGIEEVRQQIATAAMKDWYFIRHQTWHEWRQKHPRPLLLEEADLNQGALFPGLKAFERRYRATYGQNASSADVLVAFNNHKARLEREQALRNLQSA